ncbi:MAG: hypothetical protein NTX86_05805 [Candidatus Dependentiae bacterium]|nr:hypothetical protein [Candidatus Dependentiae bacterium]
MKIKQYLALTIMVTLLASANQCFSMTSTDYITGKKRIEKFLEDKPQKNDTAKAITDLIASMKAKLQGKDRLRFAAITSLENQINTKLAGRGGMGAGAAASASAAVTTRKPWNAARQAEIDKARAEQDALFQQLMEEQKKPVAKPIGRAGVLIGDGAGFIGDGAGFIDDEEADREGEKAQEEGEQISKENKAKYDAEDAKLAARLEALNPKEKQAPQDTLPVVGFTLAKNDIQTIKDLRTQADEDRKSGHRAAATLSDLAADATAAAARTILYAPPAYDSEENKRASLRLQKEAHAAAALAKEKAELIRQIAANKQLLEDQAKALQALKEFNDATAKAYAAEENARLIPGSNSAGTSSTDVSSCPGCKGAASWHVAGCPSAPKSSGVVSDEASDEDKEDTEVITYTPGSQTNSRRGSEAGSKITYAPGSPMVSRRNSEAGSEAGFEVHYATGSPKRPVTPIAVDESKADTELVEAAIPKTIADIIDDIKTNLASAHAIAAQGTAKNPASPAAFGKAHDAALAGLRSLLSNDDNKKAISSASSRQKEAIKTIAADLIRQWKKLYDENSELRNKANWITGGWFFQKQPQITASQEAELKEYLNEIE